MPDKKPPAIRYILSKGPAAAAEYLADKISRLTHEGRFVFWFLSGGSAIDVAVLAASKIKSPTPKLAVTLADERYGPSGHPGSNWAQLERAGFSLPGARLEPILRGADESKTLAEFNELAADLLESSAFKIALLGIGADGHTAGLLPGSPVVKSSKFVDSYTGPDYRRLTLTARGLELLDEAVVYVQGEAKRPTLTDLSRDISPNKQPAQILKRIPIVAIYNDLVGGEDENSS